MTGIYTGAAVNVLILPDDIEESCLKAIGCLLLVSGFFVVLAALALMNSFASRAAFALAGVAVEVLGFGLLVNGHRTPVKEQR
jgi:hypothetical protein